MHAQLACIATFINYPFIFQYCLRMSDLPLIPHTPVVFYTTT